MFAFRICYFIIRPDTYITQIFYDTESTTQEYTKYLLTEVLCFWNFSIVRYSKEYKHDVSETGSVSVLR
jgi:hypothetical protein